MKKILKSIILIAFILSQIYVNAQISTQIDQVVVNSQSQYTNCDTIDFGTNSNNNLVFYFTLNKNSSYSVEDGNLKIKLKSNSSSNGVEKENFFIPASLWNNTQYSHTISTNISANEVQVSGSSIYLEFTETSEPFDYYNSCEHPIIKTPVPEFTLYPPSLNISCGDTSSKTFTVTPSNIPSGASVTYQWNYSGWTLVGSTTTSRTLQPSSGTNLPSDVSVTPSINGVAQTTLTSNVSRSNFNVSYVITGASSVCDIGLYTVSNLPNDISITSVESSDDNIATVSFVNDQITVTKVSDGSVTISATLQNQCGQTDTITKNIEVGVSGAINAVMTGSSVVCGVQSYTYTVNANHPCINSFNWSVSSNLTIVSQNSNSITVTKNLFITQNAGLITASISGSDIEIKKGIWVGLPVNTSLNIQKIGSYDFFAGQWTKLKANYTPFQYLENEPFNLSFDWQIPNSQIRSFPDTAYKDVNPNNSGSLNIGVRVVCDCGNGDWIYRVFNVISLGGGFEMH